MIFFKKYFFICLTVIPLLLSANEEFPFIESEQKNKWEYFGEFQVRFTSREVQQERTNTVKRKNINYNSLQLNMNYTDGGFHFEMTPYAYFYISEAGYKPKGPNFSEPFEKEDLFFRTLYVSYTIDNLTAGVGVLPLSNSFPNQYKKNYYQDGEGLSIISDIDPLAVFLKYRFNDEHHILLGAGYIDTYFIPTGKYFNTRNVEKTYGIFAKQTIFEDKFQIINDFTYTKVYFNGKEAADYYAVASGISWDDSEYSGVTIYNALGFSLLENKSLDIKDDILASMGLSSVPAMYKDNFSFDHKQYRGSANLLGLRKDFEVMNLESFINLEWFHVMGDWISANKGSPYHTDGNYMSNIRDNAYFMAYGARLSENFNLRLSHSHIEFDKKENIGAPNSVPVEESYGAQLSYIGITKLVFSYTF